jgi:nicotinamidase-related amidase
MSLLRVPYKMLLAPIPPFPLGPGNTALLLIDAQHFTTTRSQGLGQLANERGIDREFDEYYAQVDAALPNMTKLIAACRARGVTVMHTVLCGARPDGGDRSRQMRVSGLPLPIGDPRRQIRPEVAAEVHESVFPRTCYSPFTSGEIATALRSARVDTILLAGMIANYSVWQAAREAADRDFGVIVVMDCCASETFAWHTQLRVGVIGGLIRQRSCTEVIEMMEGTRT